MEPWFDAWSHAGEYSFKIHKMCILFHYQYEGRQYEIKLHFLSIHEFWSLKILRFIFQHVHWKHLGVIINKIHDRYISISIWNENRATKIKIQQSSISTCSWKRIMKQLFAMFLKDTTLTLLQIPSNSKKTKNTIVFQLTKGIIINVSKTSMF